MPAHSKTLCERQTVTQSWKQTSELFALFVQEPVALTEAAQAAAVDQEEQVS